MKYYSIAIDGPAGAGKSSIAKMLAQKLGFNYIDTGAMYRAITLKAIHLGIDLYDESAFTFLDQTEMFFREGILYMDGKDMTNEIRNNEISNNVSIVASHIGVRNNLVAIQKKIAENTNVVMDGRDIGTVVLPKANLKIFMTASVEERAKRRYEENVRLGIPSDYKQLIQEIKRRDNLDSSRKYNPLRKADDAILLDTSNMSMEEVSDYIYRLFIQRSVKESE